MTAFLDGFLEEAGEHLSELEAGLLQLESDSGNTELVGRVFRAAHSIKGGASMLGLSDIARFTHGMENLLDAVRRGRTTITPTIANLLLYALDVLATLLGSARSNEPAAEATWNVLAQLEGACAPVEPDDVESGVVEAAHAFDRRVSDRRAAGGAENSIRVATDKVDTLIDLVGEIVIAQSMVAQLVGDFDHGRLPQLEEAVAALERNIRELQERVMSIRMLPIGTLFSRFPRMVRDTGSALGKQVTLELCGEETELDKAMIERLGDPLTHIIRNAIDHGIETEAARRAAGKPENAVVRISAFHEAGNVVIEIADDGRGLDAERIRTKAIAQGLIAADDVLTPEQIHGLIFRAGFSTADAVSDLSGRGVGMDVVRRNVEELNGTVSISTVPAAGTTFRIKLPLTLAILDGMGLRVAAQTYVIPTSAILESFQPTCADIKRVLAEGEVVLVRGEVVPLRRLHALLGMDGAQLDPTSALVVVLEHGGGRLGLLVDELVGQSQVVIKSLEPNFRRVDGVTGATIMGDGRVALILDVEGLMRMATSASTTAQAAA